jgi:site-specific recombinase XerD
MATVKFIRKGGKNDPEKEAVIYAQYTHNEKTALFTTGKKLKKKHWNFTTGQAKGFDRCNDYNKSFDKLKHDIIVIADRLKTEGSGQNANQVKEAYERNLLENQPEYQFVLSVPVLWEEFIENRKNTIAPLTYANEMDSLERFREFLTFKKKPQIFLQDFTLKLLAEWKNYLSEPKKPKLKKSSANKTKLKKLSAEPKPKKPSANTVAKRLKHFKRFLRNHVEENPGVLPFDLNKIKYKEVAGLKVSLTAEELEALINHSFTGRKAEVRDMFVLQCNTGLRVSDLKRVDENIHNEKIKITAKKNRGEIEIPINPTIRAILERYNYKLPQIPDQKYNETIKDVFKEVFPDTKLQVRNGEGFEMMYKHELISSHDAIRTFITLSAERGMSIPSIARITGKTVAVVLKHYLNDSQKTAEVEFEKAWGIAPLKIAR